MFKKCEFENVHLNMNLVGDVIKNLSEAQGLTVGSLIFLIKL